jgi:dihydrofolate reductase
MRRVLLNVMVRLDGHFDDLDGGIDWHKVDDGEHKAYASGLLYSVDTLLFGRKTHEAMTSCWPTPVAVGLAAPTQDELAPEGCGLLMLGGLNVQSAHVGSRAKREKHYCEFTARRAGHLAGARSLEPVNRPQRR